MKYTLLAIPFATLALLTGCGGSSSSGDDSPALPPPPPPPAAPTVTVTAPPTASFAAFDVSWASTDATSCSSTDLTGVSATSGTVSLSGQSVGSHTYTVTCTGPGGSADGSAVTVVAAPAAFTLGTQTYGIDGFEDDPQLPPNQQAVVPTPNPQTFNNGSTAWSLAPSALDPLAAPDFSGSFVFAAYSVAVPGFQITLNIPARVLTVPAGGTVVYDDTTDPAQPTLTITNITFTESSPGASCISIIDPLFCSAVPDANTPTTGNIVITYDDATLTTYQGVARTFQQITTLPGYVPGLPCKFDTPDGSAVPDPVDPNNDPATYNACANAVLTFNGSVL